MYVRNNGLSFETGLESFYLFEARQLLEEFFSQWRAHQQLTHYGFLKKIDNKYFCSKRHKGDKRVYEAGYLKEFLLDSFTFW